MEVEADRLSLILPLCLVSEDKPLLPHMNACVGVVCFVEYCGQKERAVYVCIDDDDYGEHEGVKVGGTQRGRTWTAPSRACSTHTHRGHTHLHCCFLPTRHRRHQTKSTAAASFFSCMCFSRLGAGVVSLLLRSRTGLLSSPSFYLCKCM